MKFSIYTIVLLNFVNIRDRRKKRGKKKRTRRLQIAVCCFAFIACNASMDFSLFFYAWEERKKLSSLSIHDVYATASHVIHLLLLFDVVSFNFIQFGSVRRSAVYHVLTFKVASMLLWIALVLCGLLCFEWIKKRHSCGVWYTCSNRKPGDWRNMHLTKFSITLPIDDRRRQFCNG